jgi:signal transduction histidine kinase
MSTASLGGRVDTRRLRATERSLIRIRWFAVAFGVFQVWQLGSTAPTPPGWVMAASYASIAALGVGNVVISRASHTEDLHTLRLIGAFAFALDTLVVFTNVWVESYDRNATTWTLAYVLPLEGAIRYHLRGASISIVAFSISEFARELYRLSLFDDLGFQISSVTYRVGIFAIIALVAGMMAAGSERERLAAEDRAVQLEHMAARERTARAEVEALHDVVMAGLVGGELTETVNDTVEAMARAFGYETFAIGLLEDGPEGRQLRCVGAYGFPEGTVGRTLPADRGVVGRVVAAGRPQLVSDTKTDPDFERWLSGARSEMAAPIRARNRVIGVVDVESAEPDHFGSDDIARLERLASQIGLVISNARLLAQERATVERLRELDAMKSDFVAVTSHELRTPLTAVQGFIKTLRRPDVRLSPDEMAEFLAIVDRQAERLTRLVEGLLLTARIDAGTVDLQMDSVDVPTVLGEVLLELEPDRRRVQLEIDPSLPRMVTDGQRLGQIARNLIENALKFSPEDALVRVTAVPEGGSLVLEVADRGPGIPPQELTHIFERFHQVGGALSRRGQGLGLGLYIVRNIVDALNGSVAVRSFPGEGATFSVRIPLVPAEESRLSTGA